MGLVSSSNSFTSLELACASSALVLLLLLVSRPLDFLLVGCNTWDMEQTKTTDEKCFHKVDLNISVEMLYFNLFTFCSEGWCDTVSVSISSRAISPRRGADRLSWVPAH